jgi:hypothetical protein
MANVHGSNAAWHVWTSLRIRLKQEEQSKLASCRVDIKLGKKVGLF